MSGKAFVILLLGFLLGVLACLDFTEDETSGNRNSFNQELQEEDFVPSEEEMSEEEVVTSRKLEFTSNSLSIDGNMMTNADIQPYSGDKILIEVKCSAEARKEISIRESGGVVYVKNDKNVSSSMNIINGSIITSSNGISISGSVNGRIIVNGVDVTDKVNADKGKYLVDLTIKVPLGASLDISGCNKVNVGEVGGNVSLSCNAGTYNIQKANNVQSSIQGSGNILISEVRGNISASIQGSGDFVAKRGNIKSISASIQGSGDLSFGGTTQTANLSVQGSGDIDIYKVTGRVSKRIQGSGDINIRN